MRIGGSSCSHTEPLVPSLLLPPLSRPPRRNNLLSLPVSDHCPGTPIRPSHVPFLTWRVRTTEGPSPLDRLGPPPPPPTISRGYIPVGTSYDYSGHRRLGSDHRTRRTRSRTWGTSKSFKSESRSRAGDDRTSLPESRVRGGAPTTPPKERPGWGPVIVQ